MKVMIAIKQHVFALSIVLFSFTFAAAAAVHDAKGKPTLEDDPRELCKQEVNSQCTCFDEPKDCKDVLFSVGEEAAWTCEVTETAGNDNERPASDGDQGDTARPWGTTRTDYKGGDHGEQEARDDGKGKTDSVPNGNQEGSGRQGTTRTNDKGRGPVDDNDNHGRGLRRKQGGRRSSGSGESDRQGDQERAANTSCRCSRSEPKACAAEVVTSSESCKALTDQEDIEYVLNSHAETLKTSCRTNKQHCIDLLVDNCTCKAQPHRPNPQGNCLSTSTWHCRDTGSDCLCQHASPLRCVGKYFPRSHSRRSNLLVCKELSDEQQAEAEEAHLVAYNACAKEEEEQVNE